MRWRWTIPLFLLPIVACVGAPMRSVDVRRPAQLPGSLLIRNVDVLDVETGSVSSDMDVLIEGAIIAAIEPHGRLEAGAGGQVIPGSGAMLVPGLIDMHAHIVIGSGPVWEMALPDAEANLRAYAYAGVTTIFDPADSSDEPWARRKRVADGELIGPRIFTAGPLLTCPGGHPIAMMEELAPWWIAWYLAPRVAIPLDNEATVNRVVDELAQNQPDMVKIAMDRIPLSAPRMSRETAEQVVTRAKSHGLRVAAHIGTTQDAIDAAEAGVSLWVHGVYKERIPDEQIARLASYGIPMVTTTEVFDRYARGMEGPIDPTPLEIETVPAEVLESFYPLPDDLDLESFQSWLELAGETRSARVDNVRRLHEAGVTILAGSDTQSGVFPGAGLHRELAQLVRAGLTPVEAIRAATLDPARFLANGGEPDAGSIAVGKRADLLLVEGDPTKDVAALSRLRQVFLAGVPIERIPVPAQ